MSAEIKAIQSEHDKSPQTNKGLEQNLESKTKQLNHEEHEGHEGKKEETVLRGFSLLRDLRVLRGR